MTLRHRRRRTRAFLLGAGCLLGSYLALYLAVSGRPVLPVDLEVRAWVQPMRHGQMDRSMQLVSLLGEATGLLPMILLASLALWRAHRRWAMLLPLVMAGTGVLQYLAKWSADRPRPSEAPWGFPSGHALSVVVLAGVFVYLIASTSGRRRRARLLACLGCATPVAAVGFSRIYLDMHWLSDVVGGLLAGTGYLLLVIAVVEIVGHSALRRLRVPTMIAAIGRSRPSEANDHA